MKLLICGTRVSKNKEYRQLVWDRLRELYWELSKEDNFTIIEGCCPNSADKYAEQFVEDNNQDWKIGIKHYPSTSGNYLKRNIEMVQECDMILAFWNGFSYGTAHTIAQGVANGKKVRVVMLK